MARVVFVKGNDCNGRNDYPGRTGMYINHQYSVLSYITRNYGRSAFLSDLSVGQQSGSMQKLKKSNQKLFLYRKHLSI